MKFCSSCGSSVARRVPNGDNRERFVCDACGTIHYQNPKIVTGCLPVYGDQILLCRRAIAPRSGLWTLPAGFLENGETSTQGAIRETLEEACANVAVEGLYTIFNLPHISQVYMFFRAELLDLDFRPGWESTDVRLFREHEVPWDELAFPVIHDTLRHYFADRASGVFPVRVGDIDYSPKK
jgi:ADP-ribose pyrophosphatase YjhB (NUDIX family)